jgi:hypothetical protein
MVRKACLGIVILSLVGGPAYWLYAAYLRPAAGQDAPEIPRLTPLDFSGRAPVALNRGPEVEDPFQGDVHPTLRRNAELSVTASWDIRNKNQGDDPAFFKEAPPDVRAHLMGFEPDVPTRTYTERDFSRFLPAKEPSVVGQVWALDADRVASFLTQFHPHPSMRLVAKGRRPGPDGAFAVLRAVSPTHLDVLFRAHAEFDVRPIYFRGGAELWYSPSCFLGRMVVNRKTGTVDYFRLGLPTDTFYNVHVTAATGNAHGEMHGWMRVDRMELTGGDGEGVGRLAWAKQIEPADAFNRLAKVFYKFKEIDWVPFEKSHELARARKKPLLVVIALGALDNQTC